MHRSRLARLLLAIVLAGGLTPVADSAGIQEVDPFYTRLLEKAEQNLMEGRYSDVLENIRVALFGLNGHEQLVGKAFTLSGLCRYYLGEKTISRADLEKAHRILGADGLRALDLENSHQANLMNILNYFRFSGFFNPIPQVLSIPDLEKILDSNPRDSGAAYQLADLYFNGGHLNKARKTLGALLHHLPEETEALFRLGEMHYKKKKYKEAGRFLARFAEAAAQRNISENRLATGRAYEILSAFHRRDRKRVRQLIEATRTILTREKILALPLEISDRAALAHLLEITSLPRPG